MEEIQMVIMEKDPVTGFLEKELGSYAVPYHELVVNAYALKEQSGYEVHMKLSCDKELEDWAYNAVYDYYDSGKLLDCGLLKIEEVEGSYNPTWEIVFAFLAEKDDMEDFLDQVMQAHFEELESVYEAIQDKKAEYEEAPSGDDDNNL